MQGHLPLPATWQGSEEVYYYCYASREPACLLKHGICRMMNSDFKIIYSLSK